MLSHRLTRRAYLIGDLVGSRRAPDRVALQETLREALAVANTRIEVTEEFAATIGDEFQGVVHSLGDAARATLLIRASMPEPYDVRFGIGVGEVMVLDRQTARTHQDGPGWWAARDAIEFVGLAGRRRGIPKTLRTWIRLAEDSRQAQPPTLIEQSGDPEVQALNAHLVARDHLVSAMGGRDLRILRGLLLGQTASEIAEQEEISVSAVSQRAQRSGAAALAFTATGLGGGWAR